MKKKMAECINRKHHQRHVLLHKQLDELAADFIFHTGKLPSKTTILELMNWSYQQTKNPEEILKDEKENE